MQRGVRLACVKYYVVHNAVRRLAAFRTSFVESVARLGKIATSKAAQTFLHSRTCTTDALLSQAHKVHSYFRGFSPRMTLCYKLIFRIPVSSSEQMCFIKGCCRLCSRQTETATSCRRRILMQRRLASLVVDSRPESW